MFSVEKIPPSSVHPCSSNPLEDDLPRRIILDPKSLVSFVGVFLFQFPFFLAVCRDFIVYILSVHKKSHVAITLPRMLATILHDRLSNCICPSWPANSIQSRWFFPSLTMLNSAIPT